MNTNTQDPQGKTKDPEDDLPNNTPEAADIVSRAQSGDFKAMTEIHKMGITFIPDVPGKLAELDASENEQA